jgi:hypothetical protein
MQSEHGLGARSITAINNNAVPQKSHRGLRWRFSISLLEAMMKPGLVN